MRERKLILVDIRAARPDVKPCSTCRVSPQRVQEVSDFDIRNRGEAERRKLEEGDWWFDLAHADTKRFHDFLSGDVTPIDLVFAVALMRAKP